MQKFTDEQLNRANEVDLLPFLERRGERFKKSGSEWRWTLHDSVTVRDNHWFRFSNNTGGGPVDFMMEFYEMTFPQAVAELLEGEMPGGDDWMDNNKNCPGCAGKAISQKSETAHRNIEKIF